MKKLVFFFFSSLIVFAVTIYFRLGGHKPVEIQIGESPEFFLIYKEHIGPYHKINDTIVSVETWAGLNRVPCKRTFGEYLDDPRLVDERRLRSNGGCIIDGADSQFLSSLKLSDGVLSKVQPSRRAVIAKFSGAPSISPFKVYPKVEDFLQEKNLQSTGAVFEIYSFDSERSAATEYVFTLK